MMKLAAGEPINLYEGEGFKGFGKLGLENESAFNADSIFTKFISSAIGLITVIAIIWFIFIFLTGAIGIISSGGDKNSNEAARKKISSGIIGLVVVVLGIFIIKLIGTLIGLPDILNFPAMFSNLVGVDVN